MWQVLCDSCFSVYDLDTQTLPVRCRSCGASGSFVGPYIAEGRITRATVAEVVDSPFYAVAYTDHLD
jgi:hypothetical protein